MIGHINVPATHVFQLACQAVGHAGKDRASQHQKLSRPGQGQYLVERAIELTDRGIEILIHGGANGNDDGLGIFENSRIDRGLDKPRGHALREQGVRIVLMKRHPAGVYPGNALGTRVEQIKSNCLASSTLMSTGSSLPCNMLQPLFSVLPSTGSGGRALMAVALAMR